MEREINRPLSQNWAARESAIRLKAAVEGAVQSVNKTGSQMAKARTGLPANRSKISPAAEAPCRHTGQVGDRSKSTRTSSFAALNAVFDLDYILRRQFL
jgi:hypothetical protein